MVLCNAVLLRAIVRPGFPELIFASTHTEEILTNTYSDLDYRHQVNALHPTLYYTQSTQARRKAVFAYVPLELVCATPDRVADLTL